MRIFIALQFPEFVKSELSKYIEILRNDYSGNYTLYDNLHLTIYYIGEVNEQELGSIIYSLKKVNLPKFSYKTAKLNSFKGRNNHRLVNFLIEDNPQLMELHFNVIKALKQAGVKISSENFTPHITLGRKVDIDVASLQKIEAKSLEILASRISVMESKRVDGVLVYVELDYVLLKK